MSEISQNHLFALQEIARNIPAAAGPVRKVFEALNEDQRSNKKGKPTDDELAKRYCELHQDIAYGLGEWRHYENGVWSRIQDYEVRRGVTEVLQNAKLEGIRPTDGLVNSVMKFVQTSVEVESARWDGDPEILVCKNGTLHITSAQLLPHSPNYYATFGLNFDYDPEAKATTWIHVLQTVMPEAKEYFQEFAGYCLMTDTSHEQAVWLVGPPGGGKSTLQEGLQTMAGNRAVQLGLADIEQSRFSLGGLQGKTLALASEQPAGFIRASWLLNRIISGEPISTERKFKDPVEIRPRVKVLWAMNEMPRVSEAGNGLFRRVKVIKCRAIPESERDPRIKEAICNEGAGILNWALIGLRRLNERGRFEVPPCIKDATADFQKNNDVVGLFMQERCTASPNQRTQSQVLYDQYKQWCYETGHKPMSSTTIVSEWERLGFIKTRIDGKTYWNGVKLNDL